jgi:hypothetical protein
MPLGAEPGGRGRVDRWTWKPFSIPEELTMSLTIAAPPAVPPQPAYLQRPFPVVVILSSFLILTLPLCVLSLTSPGLLERYYAKPLFIWLLGTTHFVITLTIYVQSRNLRYFNSTWKNRALYFLIPAGIFIFFDLYSAFQFAIVAPAFDRLFRAGIRLMDNHHVTRQSFGVTQLFKKRSGGAFPSWMRPAEDGYFHVLTALLLLTFFAGGRFNGANPLMLLGVAIAAPLFLVVLAGFARAWKGSEDRGAVLAALTYFLMQSGSTALGIYQTQLYIYCLAMHYVEYHVLMVPRCFSTPLDSSNPTDRAFGRLRRNRWLFYGVLLIIAGIATYTTWIAMGWLINKSWNDWPAPYRVLLALFDGLFVFHYFVEALIWKFGNPFYRATLGPLYFAPQAPSRSAAPVTAGG